MTTPTEQAKRDRRRRRREDLVRPLGVGLAAALLVVIVLTYAVSVLKERQDRINEVAVTARAAAVEAKQATSRTRVIAVSNARNARVAKELADQLNRAVCAWRHDLQGRVDDQQRGVSQNAAFLRDHPDGFVGIPVKVLADGLRDKKAALKNLRSTVRAFRAVDCK